MLGGCGSDQPGTFAGTGAEEDGAPAPVCGEPGSNTFVGGLGCECIYTFDWCDDTDWSSYRCCGPGETNEPGGTSSDTDPSASTSAESADSADGADSGSETGSPRERPTPVPMIQVPAGEFIRGNGPIGTANAPTEAVSISEFWIDSTEVTLESYSLCVDAGACSPGEEMIDPSNPDMRCNTGAPGREKHPINCVTKTQSTQYCEWVGKRLPTEHEWEKAARGVDGRSYPWGEAPPTCALAIVNETGSSGCGTSNTQPVGIRPAGASPYGVQDMVGNVAEWVSDEFDYYPVPTPPDYQGPLPGEGMQNEISRGGGFEQFVGFWELTYWRQIATVAGGGRQDEETWGVNYGFRCAAGGNVDKWPH